MSRIARFAAILIAFGVVASAAEDGPATRIVSLSPHLTEIVFHAGAGDRLVGVVEFSDYPDAALQIPRIGDAFRFDRERLASVGPDLVLAWEGGTPASAIEQLLEDGYRVETIRTSEPEDIALAMERIGSLVEGGQVPTRDGRPRGGSRVARAGEGVLPDLGKAALYRRQRSDYRSRYRAMRWRERVRLA